MRNNYIGQIEVDGQIAHLVEIIHGPDYGYVVYAVTPNGYYVYSA